MNDMRTILMALVLGFGLSLNSFAQEAKINWMTVEEVTEAMKSDPRPIMMDVYTTWCGPCKMMMANTFTNENLIKYVNKHYYAVKFNAESPDPVVFKGKEFTNPDYDPARRGRNGVHQLSRALKVSAYPTIVYFDREFNVITANSGYKQPRQIEVLLKFFNEEFSRETSDTEVQNVWDEYNANFTPTW